MSTRSNIAIRKEDGSISAIYCHSDGYVEGGVGETLFRYYGNTVSVNKLIALGDISSLESTPENTYYKSYFYRGERKHIAQYKDFSHYMKEVDAGWIEYIYIFDEKNHEWEVGEYTDNGYEFQSLKYYF